MPSGLNKTLVESPHIHEKAVTGEGEPTVTVIPSGNKTAVTFSVLKSG